MRAGILVLALALVWPLSASAIKQVTLYALFHDKAILLVDGSRRVVQRGETTPEGVKLLSTNTGTEEAVIEIDGNRETLKLNVIISGFTRGGTGNVILYAEPDGHFHADGLINDVAVRFLVDTGATTIAMSSEAARRVGLNYKNDGQRGFATTAGGVVPIYGIKLRKVQVGDIMLHDVEAGVIEGNFPPEILLGMSFLSRLDMKRSGNRLELTQRF